jgi:hypothetical protein
MRGIRNGRSHLKRQGLLSPVLSGVLSNPLTLPSGPLGDIGTILSLGPSPSTTTSTTSSQPTTSSSTTPTASPSVYETTSGGSVHTVTTFVDPSPSPTQSVGPVHQSFLQNKALSGVVFALAGVAGVIIIITVATFVLRRRRNKRLLQEAISFDPMSMNDSYHHGADMGRGSMEKRSISTDDNHELTTLPRIQDQRPQHGQEFGYGADYTPHGFGPHPHPLLPRTPSPHVEHGPTLHPASRTEQ